MRRYREKLQEVSDSESQTEPLPRINAIGGLDTKNDYVYVFGGDSYRWRDEISEETQSAKKKKKKLKRNLQSMTDPGVFESSPSANFFLVYDGFDRVREGIEPLVGRFTIISSDDKPTESNKEMFTSCQVDCLDLDGSLSEETGVLLQLGDALCSDSTHIYFITPDRDEVCYVVSELFYCTEIRRWQFHTISSMDQLSVNEAELLTNFVIRAKEERMVFIYQQTIGIIVQDNIDEGVKPFQQIIIFDLTERKFQVHDLYPADREASSTSSNINCTGWPASGYLERNINDWEYTLVDEIWRLDLVHFRWSKWGNLNPPFSLCNAYTKNYSLFCSSDGCVYIYGGELRCYSNKNGVPFKDSIDWAKINGAGATKMLPQSENFDGSEEYVVNCVQRVWLHPPSLRKLAMRVLVSLLPPSNDSDHISSSNLLFSEPVECMKYFKNILMNTE
uniref:Uncharacterized protein n=1 Tax=Ditylenchus dipsaci TaxID=166011 RepID=A0A915D0B5_9BILA